MTRLSRRSSGRASGGSMEVSLLEGGNERSHQTKNQLGTFNGCYIPCCLNILGIILFQRLSWAVGQAGVLGTLGILVLAETMAILTVLSFCAIVTNGNMAGGGSYFMISRSLGPEFGGAIGLLFYLAYAVGVSFYILGFATVVQSTWFPQGCDFVVNVMSILNIKRVIGTCGLIFILGISLVGAEAFAKFNVWFFVLQASAIAIGAMSFLVPSSFDVPEGTLFYPNATGGWDPASGDQLIVNHGFSGARLSANMFPKFTVAPYSKAEDACHGTTCTFAIVFSICFPMATGIMEGANLSGDLKDPAKSIPAGTIGAVVTAVAVYSFLIVTMGGSFDRDVLLFDYDAYQQATVSPYILVGGIIISSISSGLGSLFGGSRVLQAIARDQLFPYPFSAIGFFAKGSDHGDEPRRAVVITYLIAQGCVLIGSVDVLAGIITSFFCMSYCLCNLTCFALRITGAPNFRPTFRYFTWHTALLGAILNLAVMFFLSWESGMIAMAFLGSMWLLLYFKGNPKDWGDVSQALMYHQVRKYLLRLGERQDVHTKFWRPSFLLLIDDGWEQTDELVAFCEHAKKGGLFIIGNVLIGDIRAKVDDAYRMKSSWLSLIKTYNIKAFPQVGVAPDPRAGYQILMMTCGLGGMDINTVVIPLMQPRLDDAVASAAMRMNKKPARGKSFVWTANMGGESMSHFMSRRESGAVESKTGPSEYIAVIQDALLLKRNVIIGANFGGRWQQSVSQANSLARSPSKIPLAFQPESSFGTQLKRHSMLVKPGSFVDVWLDTTPALLGQEVNAEAPMSYKSTSALMLQLCAIVQANQRWAKDAKMRVLKVVQGERLSKSAHDRVVSIVRDRLLQMRVMRDLESIIVEIVYWTDWSPANAASNSATRISARNGRGAPAPAPSYVPPAPVAQVGAGSGGGAINGSQTVIDVAAGAGTEAGAAATSSVQFSAGTKSGSSAGIAESKTSDAARLAPYKKLNQILRANSNENTYQVFLEMPPTPGEDKFLSAAAAKAKSKPSLAASNEWLQQISALTENVGCMVSLTKLGEDRDIMTSDI